MTKKEALETIHGGDKILFIGVEGVTIGVVETISKNGCVNLHDIDNDGHYYRVPDEYEKLLDAYQNPIEQKLLDDKNYSALFFATKCRKWHDACEECLKLRKNDK